MATIDTYQLATSGQNLTNTYTFATNGILINIRVIDLEPEIESDAGGADDEIPTYISKKKVIVTVTIQGKKYTEEVIVLNKPDLKASDVKVDVKTDDRPVIGIEIV